MKKMKKRYIFIGIIALLIIFSAIGTATEEETPQAEEPKQETKQQEEQKKEEEAKKEEEEKQAVITAFNESAKQVVEQSNGGIADITIEDVGTYFEVNVFVDERIWANSNESQKSSFSTSVGNTIKSYLEPHDSFIDFVSSVNGDTVAKEKTFGSGWDIKR